MDFTLKLKKSKAYNPSTKEHGYRTTVKANGRFGLDALVEAASKNTTMHKAEVRMALELAIDAIADADAFNLLLDTWAIPAVAVFLGGRVIRLLFFSVSV